MANSDRGEWRGIYSVLLSDLDFRRLSIEAKTLWFTLKLYLPQSGIAVVPAWRHVFSHFVGIEPAEIALAMQELVDAGQVELDDATSLIWLKNGLRFDPNLSSDAPNHRKYVQRTVAGLPSGTLSNGFRTTYSPYFEDQTDPPHPSRTPRKGRKTVEKDSNAGPFTPPEPIGNPSGTHSDNKYKDKHKNKNKNKEGVRVLSQEEQSEANAPSEPEIADTPARTPPTPAPPSHNNSPPPLSPEEAHAAARLGLTPKNGAAPAARPAPAARSGPSHAVTQAEMVAYPPVAALAGQRHVRAALETFFEHIDAHGQDRAGYLREMSMMLAEGRATPEHLEQAISDWNANRPRSPGVHLFRRYVQTVASSPGTSPESVADTIRRLATSPST